MSIRLQNIFIIVLVVILLLQLICELYKTLSFEMFETKNALDGIDAIYWINLDRATDRHDSMIKLLSDESFDNIAKFRITAVDGKNPDIVNDKFYDMSNKSDSPTDYEYACLFSHLDSIRKFSESEYNLGLILEDDVTLEFKPYWKETIRDIQGGLRGL